MAKGNTISEHFKPFLQEVAETVSARHQKLEDLTIVFPNRRAVIYFRKYLGEIISKPVFSPALLTIEDFIGRFSNMRVADQLELVSILYNVYRKHQDNSGHTEPFEEFYFWGEMLLRDFDEIDKYHIDAKHLFMDLSHQKELDSTFDFLTDEQKTFLEGFWSNFRTNPSVNQKKFSQVWGRLFSVYSKYKETLSQLGLAYDGMLHREVAESVDQRLKAGNFPGGVAFAGFNALTRSEELIISYCVENFGAEVYWDMDAYYVNNAAFEAGSFFRQYQQHRVLGKTFPPNPPANFHEKKSSGTVKVFGAAQPIGQSKLMSQVLREQLDNGMVPEETLIVLPDERILFPVLHGVSGAVDKLNVTMGFPLSSTPMFNLIELLLDLQITRKKDHFNHRQVLALLGHPYVVAADPVSVNAKRKEILRHNWVHIPKSYLATEVQLHRLIFHEIATLDNGIAVLTDYLKTIITEIGALNTISKVDKEYAFYFVKFLNRVHEVLGDRPNEVADTVPALKSFLRLLRQLIRSLKIPFVGEPLKGLQVMGVLETRGLDYKNVFILSLNEGVFPSASAKGSFIPYSIRKAYQLPGVEHQDAMYAYLFYRSIQRAENVFLFHNSETDVLGQGEMSRFLQQLIFESNLKIERKTLHNPIQPQAINSITVPKSNDVLASLVRLNEGNQYFVGISPSALNTYIECRLKFYLRYVAKIKEADEVEEELDARVLGNFLHDVMEAFYKQICEAKKSKRIESSDLENATSIINDLIDKVFIEAYRLDPSKKVEYSGQRLVVREIVKRFAHRIVEIDREYAPFTIEALEQGGMTFNLRIDKHPHKVVVGGKIDRVDMKDGMVRIIDYKTGKDKLSFDTVASLFARDGKRNKAAFQTLLYALLFKQNSNFKPGDNVKMVPGLINRLNLFDDGFTFGLKVGKDTIGDVDILLPEFENHLKSLFEELYDPAAEFNQTTDHENCKLCAYAKICYR